LKRFCWVLLLPPLYFAWVVWLMPTDRLGTADRSPGQGNRFFYDDFDVTAYVLRGLNANVGRDAGRLTEPDILAMETFNARLDSAPPLADRFFLEYPHVVLWVFQGVMRIADLPGERIIPHIVFDSRQHNIVWHQPRNDEEHKLWRRFRFGITCVFALSTLIVMANIVVLRWGFGEPLPPVWLLALPASLYFGLNRFDALPSLLVVLSFAMLHHRRFTLSGMLLALACLVKVYPVLLGPLFVRYLQNDRRALRSFLIGGFATGCGVLGLVFLMHGWEAMIAPYRFQLSREAEPGWTFYGIVLPEFLASRSCGIVRLGIVLVVLGLLMRSRPTSLDELLKKSVVVLIAFASLQVFFSPQWLWWFVPLLIILARNDRRLIWLVLAFDVLTYVSFPLVYDELDAPLEPIVRPLLVWIRVGLLVWIVRRILR